MVVGVTRERQQAIDMAVNGTTVADEGTFSVPLAYLPNNGETVYVVIQEALTTIEYDPTISGISSLTLEGVWFNGDYLGTSTSVTATGPGTLRVVLSVTGDGTEATVSDTITITSSLSEGL